MKENFENIKGSQEEENIFGQFNNNENLIKEKKNIISNDTKLEKSDETMKSYYLKKKPKKPVYMGEGVGLLNEKKGLKRILKTIQDDLDIENETLEEVFEPYLNNEDMSKRVIKEGTGIYWLIFMFYIVSPLFGIINLIAIFESISIMKILWQILKNAIVVYFNSLGEEDDKITKFSIYDFNNKYNYYFMFFEGAKKDSFDFNLVMFTAFLGDLLMQSRGFRVSTAVFSLINALSIILILSFSFLDYDKDDNKYTILNILYLLFSYILLFLGVGASALLSQQIIIDSNVKYNEYYKYKYKKENKYMNDYETIYLPMLEDMIISDRKEEKKEEEKVKKEEEEKVKKEEEKVNEEEKEKVKEEEKVKEQEKEEEKEKVKEEEKNDEISFPIKKSQSGYNINFTIKNADFDDIIKENKDSPLLKDDEENNNIMQNMKNSIKEVVRRKLLLKKSNTLVVTRRDEFRKGKSKEIK